MAMFNSFLYVYQRVIFHLPVITPLPTTTNENSNIYRYYYYHYYHYSLLQLSIYIYNIHMIAPLRSLDRQSVPSSNPTLGKWPIS